MRRPGPSRWPELDDDVRTEYRRDAIADERAEQHAREMGFDSAEDYDAANDDVAIARALEVRAEADRRDEDGERYTALYDQDNDTEWPSRSGGGE